MIDGKIIFIDMDNNAYESIKYYGDISPDRCMQFFVDAFNKHPNTYDDFLRLANEFNAKYFSYADNTITDIHAKNRIININDSCYTYILNTSDNNWTVKCNGKNTKVESQSIEVFYSGDKKLYSYTKPYSKLFFAKKIFIVALIAALLASSTAGVYAGYRISKNRFDKQLQTIKEKENKKKNPYHLGLVVQDVVTKNGKQIHVLEVKSKTAKAAGFKPEDIILEFNGEPVHTGRELVEALQLAEPNSIGHFLISRKGETIEIRMILK